MNVPSKYPLIALILAFAVTLPGCSGPDPAEEAKEPLSVVFDAFKRSDLEGALMLYAPTFFRSTPRQEWLAQLTQLHQQLGPVTSYEILRATSQKKTSPVSGTYVQFDCKVNYQRGSLREAIVLVRPDGLQHFTVSGHAITANQAQASGPPQQQRPAPPQVPQGAAPAQPAATGQPAPATPAATPATPAAIPATPAATPATPATPAATPATPAATPAIPAATPATPAATPATPAATPATPAATPATPAPATPAPATPAPAAPPKK